MAKRRCLMIGAGGQAGAWLRHFLPPFSDRFELAGLVDINEEILHTAGDELDLPRELRFTAMEEAFAAVQADFCAVVIPPAVHRDAVLLAAERGMDVISEKPVADSWEAAVDIYRAVQESGIRMAVTQNYRFMPRILTLKRVLESGELGRINYIMGRFAADYRAPGAWGAFRHEIPHTLLVEGAVHHFDQIRNLADADCSWISGREWNPEWSSFAGDCCGLYVIGLTGGIHAHYEGSCTAAGKQNSWHREYYRVECEHGAVTLDNDQVVRVHEHRGRGYRTISEELPERPERQGHVWIIDAFLNWLDGGPEPPTWLDDNMQTTAMLFAAIEASERGAVVDVQEKLADAGIT